MRKQRAFFALALTVSLLSTPALLGARPAEDGLSLVPADAAAAGMVRFSDLRTNPLGSRLFRDFDGITVDGDAARFLEESHLRVSQDVDTLVFAALPARNGMKDGDVLVVFEGRFEPEKLSAATAARGAVPRTATGGAYFLLPSKKDSAEPGRGAVAFVSSRLVIAGTEPAVVRALEDRMAGGTSFLSSQGLGRHYTRIESGASAFALIDVTRFPKAKRQGSETGGNSSDAGRVLVGAMSNVSLLALQVSTKGDALKLSAQGLSADAETRELIEDSLRGVLAAWRLAVQDKNPDAVSVLRKFKVSRDDESVTISGTLPGAVVRTLADQMDKKQKSPETH
ncbi:MAG: hypothetical protein L6R30_21210 [Thermoanaerobaculia bacterium]|nr:hypothetical protein [Thermoanaerobaculia bacterium]